MKQRVMHVITTLTTGGAEIMLLRLLSRMDRKAFEAEVVVLAEVGPIGEEIRKLGVPVTGLGMRPGRPDLRRIHALSRMIRGSRPHVVQTWMYHADLVGSVAARMAGGGAVVWGIHNTTLDRAASKRGTRWTAKALAIMSRRIPERVVCCADEARRIHEALGYEPSRMVTIPNGFDLDVFQPDEAARASVRAELGLPEETPLVGLVARFHPQKDHRNFIAAASLLRARVDEVHFLLCGDGVTADNPELATWIAEGGVADRCHLLGRRTDTPRILASLDILCSASSSGEAFPLVVGEAMSCGVPCVVTDVGDSAVLVGDGGRVAPPRDPAGLAAACEELLASGRAALRILGLRARDRIRERYSLDEVVRRYERLYAELIHS